MIAQVFILNGALIFKIFCPNLTNITYYKWKKNSIIFPLYHIYLEKLLINLSIIWTLSNKYWCINHFRSPKRSVSREINELVTKCLRKETT